MNNITQITEKLLENFFSTKQSVMKKARQVEEYSLPVEDVRFNVTEIHIQADEDHVSMQDGRNTIVKLATVHEQY